MRGGLEGKQYVEQYVHALTHEWKGALAAIRGSAGLLESPLPESDRARFVATIRAQGDRLAQMIDKLLALAGVVTRRRIGQPEPVALGALVDEAVAQVGTGAAAAGVSLAREGVDAAVVVEGDPFLLRQAVANLLDNAIDFAPRGSVVDIGVQREAGRVRIDVADRGPGVPDYAVGRVFERFYSLPRPDGGSRSSGLGLCFVAQVAQLHDGDATLANRDGGGAVASIDLPAIRAKQPLALLPLAGEGARRADEGASAASCSCSSHARQQPDQDQGLSRRDGASHLSLLVQRNLAQRKHTPPSRPARCAGFAEPAGFSERASCPRGKSTEKHPSEL